MNRKDHEPVELEFNLSDEITIPLDLYVGRAKAPFEADIKGLLKYKGVWVEEKNDTTKSLVFSSYNRMKEILAKYPRLEKDYE